MNTPFDKADWDAVRVFLAVANAGSLAKAADEVGVNRITVTRTLTRLEDQVGYPLFYRDTEGVRLTPEGRRLIGAAREVEKSITDMWRIAAASANTMSGQIRLAVTEGLGAFWLMPQLIPYLESQDGQNRVQLQCAMRSVDVLRLEADISVQLQEPTNPDLTVRKLGHLHLVPWASAAYLERFGTPRSFPELATHRIVEQETDQLSGYDLDRFFGAGAHDRMVLLSTNFSSGHYWAILNGAGIGLMPSYAKMIGGQVEYVDINFAFTVPIYMACHPEVLKSARHRAFADWLAEAFSPKRYPWFGEKFITPSEIEKAFDRRQLSNYFSGFVATA